MPIRLLLAAPAALCVTLLLLPAAKADIVDLTDGKRLPAHRDVRTPWGDVPGDDEILVTRAQRLDLAYDKVQLGSAAIEPAQVMGQNVWISAAYENPQFLEGMSAATMGAWDDAARAFALAAEELRGAAQQRALHLRVEALAVDSPEDAIRAADALAAAFPKAFYLGRVFEIKARILAQRGKTKEALAVLDRVIDAPGMNVRDRYNAKYLRIWLEHFVTARNSVQVKQAEEQFQALSKEIERDPKRQHASEPLMKIKMALATARQYQEDLDGAERIFGEVLSSVGQGTDRANLAALHAGMGDVVIAKAAKAAATNDKDPKLKDLYERAALHFLRVVLQYADQADQRALFGATKGVAQVLAALFYLSDEKECDLGRQAYAHYVSAVRMLGSGQEREELVRAGNALRARLEASCK